jgi:Carboxypeptidase regulatory-like domain/TonB dependent receptor
MQKRNRSWRLSSIALIAVLATFGATAIATAQTDVTTGRIGGQVTDEAGAALPGANVECRNTETGLAVTETSGENGGYRCLNLPTGTYSVSATLDGFATATADVRLVIGSAPTVNFALPQASVAETITVSADDIPVVELTNTAAGTTIRTEQINNVPIKDRDFKSLVLLTPETRTDSERGNLSISGQRGINTNVTVDGVDFNNAFFGGTVGGAEGRAPLALSQESIKEFSVITNGASVEFGRSGGGFVNVVTKSGTNSIHGSLFYYDQPQSLISDFADGRKAADTERQQYGGSLGGSIIKDRLFYFASYDNQDKTETVPIAATNLVPAIFARYPELSSPSEYSSTQDGSVAFGRLDFQATPEHRFMLRGSFTDYEGINGTSTSQTRTASFNGLEGLDTKAYVASWSGQFGGSILNDLNLNYITEDTPREDKGLGLPEIQVGSNRYGEVSFLPIVSTTERKAFGDTVTYLRGNHVFKGGVEYNDTSIDQIFKGNWRGVFIFSNNADLLAGRWNEYRQFGGLGGLTSDQAGRASFGQKETALFLQDQWFLSSKITVSGGLRFESLDNPNGSILNPNDRNANGSFNLTGKIPDADLTDQISPRLGFSWAPDQKTAIRFSAGRFWSRTPAILLAQLFTSNGLRGTQFSIRNSRDAAGNVLAPTSPLAPGWGSNFTVNGVERIDFTRIPTPSRPGVFAIDDNFENPYTDRFTLGAEREIFANTSAGLDFTYAKGEQLQRLKDINRQYDGTIGANGLPRYSATVFPFPFYGSITTSVSDAKSRYTALTAKINRRLSGGFSYYAALTYAKDKDNDSNERNFAGIQAEDYNNLDLNYAYSARDQRWKGVVNALWETPWWGIGVSGSIRYSTGSAFSALTAVDNNLDGQSGTDRPTVNGVHFGRNSFRQPDFRTLDLRISKSFTLGPGDLLLFGECFNCTDEENRFVTNFTYGNNPTPSATFGLETGVGVPRSIQFGARYDF